MTEKREVIRRLRLGHSIRQISKDTGMHRTLIRCLHALAKEQYWLVQDQPVPSESEIKDKLPAKGRTLPTPHPLDSYRDQIKGWLEEKYSYVVIHSLLKDEVSLSETTVRRYCQKRFPKAPKGTYTRETVPGEVMEVDFGLLGTVHDPIQKRDRRAYVFSARLRHSRLAWREVVYSQDQSTFFRCHVHAFEYFGGVPERVVPDNLKAAVIQASYEDPVINRVYHRLAEHYGFVIDPCPPYTPNLKGGVENDIKYIKGNFWPRFKEVERRMGNETPSSELLQKALESWSEKTAHMRVLSGVGARPTDLFHDEEADCLQALPDSRWNEVSWSSAKVHETWRVQVDRAYYSVPFQYIGKTVQVFTSDGQVEIYDDYELIATHRKAVRPWDRVLDPAHDPPNVKEFLATTREGLLRWAGEMGLHVQAVLRVLFDRKVVDSLRPARAILRMATTYGAERLNRACERALAFDNIAYGTIKRILARGLDAHPLESATDQEGNYCFQFSRPPRYFDDERKLAREA